MNLKSLLRARRVKTVGRASAKPRRAKLTVEILEGRDLLAALMFATQPIAAASGSVLKGMDAMSKDEKPIDIRIDDPSMAGSAPVTIALASNPGGGQLGGTVTRPLVNGKASFDDLFIFGAAPDQGKRGYTLVAYAGSHDPAFSNSFVVRPGATGLHIAADLGTAEAGKGLRDTAGKGLDEIVVQALDPNGGLARDAGTTQLTLFLDKNPGGARFVDRNRNPLANPTAMLSNGVARFNVKDLRMDKAGIGYTLGVEAVSNALLSSGHTNPFLVTATAAAGVRFREPITFAFVNRLLNKENGRLSNTFTGVSVQVVDRYDNPITSGPGATATVTLSLKDNPNLLLGTKSKPAVDGIARFEDLLIQQAANYTFLAGGMVGMTLLVYPASEPPFTFTVQDADPLQMRLRFVTAATAKAFPLGGRLDPIEVEVLKADGGAPVTAPGNQLLVQPPAGSAPQFESVAGRGAARPGRRPAGVRIDQRRVLLPGGLHADGEKVVGQVAPCVGYPGFRFAGTGRVG